jgi:2-keto-4-pentenoate hydratase/2-oxohepta-3-ene-1,7-dioic acid hydratase in catechol pathway
MKIVIYGPDKRVGALHAGNVVDLSLAFAKYLGERNGAYRSVELAEALVPSDLTRLIETGPSAIENAQKALDYLFGQAQDQKDPRGETLVHPANAVRIHAPRPKGTRMACAGSNFTTHRERMTRRSGRDVKAPFIWGFWKIPHEGVAPGGDVIYPARCDRLDYEGELAIILGKRGKDLRPADLKDFVWGVTLFCDWSIRSPREPLGPMNFAAPKNFDTSYSLGPCIVVGELDATNIDIETLVNGERRQFHNTRDMTFSFGDYLEYLSRDLTLYPGDIICSGTGEGTAADASPVLADGTQPPDLFLKPGDLVEVKSPAIGTLGARIVAKDAR